jgi:hypothetical protein
MALPLDDELSGEAEKDAAACKQAVNEFIDAVRKQLAGDSESVAWLAPGQLLVIGDPEMHDRAARVLAQLAGAKAQLTPEIAALRKTTMKRRDARQATGEKRSAARRQAEASRKHAHYGWQLLEAATAGRLDSEALTELQIVWKSPETTDLLKGAGRGAMLRSYWALAEAGRGMTDEPELKELISQARQLCQPAVAQAEATLKKSPDDAEAFVTVLFAGLAERDRAALAASRLKLLASPAKQTADLVSARIIANALLADPSDADKAALTAIVRGELAGEDLVALAALACRRAGGETWQAFREESQRLLGGQPLSGSVIVLVGRLDGATLAN